MDTGLIFLGTEQAVEHVPGRPEHVLTAIPRTNVWRNAVHPSGKMHAGVWDCRAGAFELPCHASTELCVITEGSAEIEDAQGRQDAGEARRRLHHPARLPDRVAHRRVCEEILPLRP